MSNYWTECMRLRFGHIAPLAEAPSLSDAEIAAPNPHDIPAAPDPYAPNAPGEAYRSIYDPYPGVAEVVDFERHMSKEDRVSAIRKALRADVPVSDSVFKKVKEFREKEAQRLRDYRAKRKQDKSIKPVAN